MRKSFTWLSSLIVLMLLSFQMALAAPQLATNGLSPADGGKIDPNNAEFTLTFKGDVMPTEGQIIGLYSSSTTQPENKAIQLRAVDKSTDGSVITYTHPDGTVTFNGKVVTIVFNDVDWSTVPNYWVTIGSSAIKDATGNFDVATAFDGGAKVDKWDFTVKDLVPPTWSQLDPRDNAIEVGVDSTFSIKFNEDVKFVDTENVYVQQLEDFAIYTSTDWENIVFSQEGGDLVSTYAPTLKFYDNGTEVFPKTVTGVAFDSISIDWVADLPGNTDLYVRIKKDMLQDLEGNKFAGMNDEDLWNITTKDDDFAKPTITAEHTPLRPNDTFKVTFDGNEVLYIATSGKKIVDDQDLKDYIKVTDKNGDPVAIKTAKIDITTTPSTNNIITVVLNANMVSSKAPYTVATTAGDFKDASGNPSKPNSEEFDAGNWDAPTVVADSTTNYSGTSFDFLITTNEPATVHYIVVKKGAALVPTINEIAGFNTDGNSYKDVATAADVYYSITAAVGTASPLSIPASNFLAEGNINRYYGKQTATDKFTIVEVFAAGTVNVPQGNFEVLKRIDNLPDTHGQEYVVYYFLADNAAGDIDPLTADWFHNTELLSGVNNVDGETVDILMPEAWFDGDSVVVAPKVLGDVKLNKNKVVPPTVGALTRLSKNGKIYINFNEAVRKFDGSAVTATDLKNSLFVYEGDASAFDKNADTPWSTNVDYSVSISADKKQITITPAFAWSSSASVWVKIRNSKIEDEVGNEIVPYGAHYAQEFEVEDYVAPLVRYTFGNIFTPMDSMINVPYQNYINSEYVAAPITVTVSEHIYVFPGAFIDGHEVTLADGLIPFTSNPDDDQYIGRFFKIRSGTEDMVNENTSDPLELTNFEFDIQFVADSTVITITPTVPYESELWYLVQIDERIHDRNLQTIAQGALVDVDTNRPTMFKLANALTGNATLSGWVRGSAATDDNQTMVFKSDDSRNPKLFFFTKQQSTLLSDLELLDGKTNISLTDTIGVYIDEWVALGFDHYFEFDDLSGEYVLDANAMRRYFKVYDENGVMMQFDVIDLDISALSNDSLIFFIDPYYVDENGVALSATENANFKAGTTYTVFFNSEDTDDMGIEDMSGKAKGIYWDDNKNLILETKAVFSTPATTPDYCVEAVVSPVPGATGLNPGAISYIDVQFNYAALGALPFIQLSEGTSSVTTIAGQLYPGNSNIVRFPVSFMSDSAYTVEIGTSIGGQITINSGIAAADTWPAEACNPTADSTWTYTMVDATAPELDTLLTVNGSWFTQPLDDDTLFDKTEDIIMVFDEEVKLVPNKRLTIYDSSNKTVVYVLAQNCQYGKNTDNSDNKHVIVVPSGLFASALEFETHYHIIVDHGFVTDFSPIANQFAGVLTEDLHANGILSTDLENDWSFRTDVDPAPYFVKFSPANGTTAVQNFSIEFSESVYAAGNQLDYISIYEVGVGGVMSLPIAQFLSNDAAKITPNANNKVWTININALPTPVEYGKQYAIAISAGAFVDSEAQALTNACTTTGISFIPATTIPVTDQTNEATATWYVNFRDDVAPSVVNVWPRDGAEHVPYNAYLYIEFNEPVALSDGSAIVPDPNLINQTIANFITITSDNGLLNGPLNAGADEYKVEFVGNNKKLLRITPFDVDGHNYSGSQGNPSMDTYINYDVTIVPSYGGYTIVDAELNPMAASLTFGFLTEDITAPEWDAEPAFDTITCADVVTFDFDIIEESDTALVYYAVVPAGAAKPSAADLFAQTVSGAIAKGVKGVDASASTLSVDLGALDIDFDNDEAFELYAVVSDLEVDIWKPSSSAWDSLFMFDPAKAYGEGYDRIRDIMPAPNKNFTVVPTTAGATLFRVTDDDAPEMVASYPEAGELEFPIGDSVRFWFSEAVTAGAALPNTIVLRRYDNNIAVDATVTWVAADSSFYITPANDLDQETKYYVEFDRYAIEDDFGVCPTGHVYYPQMVGRGFWFETEDNIGPRLYKVDPVENATCVSCPDLNEDGDEFLSIYFYDANDVVIANNASDPYIYLYRANESVVNAWDVIPASLITIEPGTNDTTWVAKVPLHHVYYPNDLIKVVVPAGLFADVYGNQATVSGSVQNKEWYYTTCNTEAPAVTWSIHNLSAHFNYSEASGGIVGEWEVDYMTGNKGAVVNNIPTHVALKVDFGEEVQFNTSGTTWKALGDLTNAELMAILKVSGLTYSTTATVSDIDQIIVDGNTVTLTFKYGTNAKLPSYQLLEDAAKDSINGDGLAFLDDYYKASLKSETEYKVTVTANKVRATNNCKDNSSPRYVESNIVTLNTRNDEAPTVSFENNEGVSLCENDAAVCIDALEEINIVFNKPVVKSSYDVRWLGEESYTWDNLPLNEDDLEATGADDFGQYIEFYPVTKGGTITAPVWTIAGSAVAVDVVALDDENKQRYVIQPEDSLASEGWYMIKFNKHTVKNYEGNDPSGTVFEGDSCYFFVGDYLAPDWDELTPSIADTTVGSDTKELVVVFDEQIAKGTGITKLRREDGTVFAEFDVNSANVVWKNKTATNVDTVVFKVDGLEEFTKYYVEMPEGYVVDNNTVCTANAFEGFAARLDASTGEMLDADWWFKTTDATPPQLISIDMEQEEMDPLALFPLVGDTVSMYSNLELIFDENIIIKSDANTGIVIYHDNGNDPSVNFGNAIEFIPWSNFFVPGSKITLTGTDKYNGLNTNKLIIDPETIFDSKGTYYVRVNGDSIVDGTGNRWSDSEITPINPVRDREWYFTIANDVAPVLVYTTPAYDGVNAAGTYDVLDATDYAYVETDLVMEFYDNTIANGGEPLNVARGDELRMLRIFEYTYDAEAAEFMSKPWIEMPITDESIEFDGNKVIVHNVMLKDGIRNMSGVSKGVVNDSCYYVTVDPGAVLNGFEDSQTWWPGISNGFRWRFTTGSDVVFVDGYEILSPNIVEDEDAARNLTIEAAGTLIVQFNEGVGAIEGTTKVVKVYDVNTTELVEAVTVTDEMCEGNILSVPLANIYDEATFYVVIEEGAFGDTATVQNENFEIGGMDVWTFHTGDNTPPSPVAVSPGIDEDCVEASPMVTLEYNESMGIVANGGTITISDAEGTQIAQIAVTDDMIDGNIVTAQFEALPDTSVLTVTLSEGMLLDGDEHSPLASPEYTWSFTTGYNTLPQAALVSPVMAEAADTVVVVEFDETAVPVNAVATLRVQGETEGVEITFTTEDSLVYSAAVTELVSEATYEVVFAAGAFVNVNEGCEPVATDEIVLTFDVADILAPDAEYFYPEYADYNDVELMMVFNDDVTRETGNVYVYDAVEDTLVLTIPVGDLTEGEGNTYTYTTSDLYYGEFYVLIDAGTFVDNTATPLAVEYAGIDSPETWPFAIVDRVFEDCYNIIAPVRNAVNIPVNTTIEISFCDERIAPPVRDGRYVTVADQSEERIEGVNVFTFFVADSMIENNTLTIEVEGLKENTTYSIIVAQGAVTDEAGNEFGGINDANEWFFTTGDGTGPEVSVDAVTINNVDGTVAITSSEVGMVFLAPAGMETADALLAAVANGTAASAPVYVAGTPVNVSAAGLAAGTYNAYAIDANGNLAVAVNVVTVEDVPVIPVYTIAEIQGTGAASPHAGEVVKTTGVVTGVNADGEGFFIQDANAARSGIYVYDPNGVAQVTKGTGVTIVGEVSEYFDLTEITIQSVEYVAPVVTVEPITIAANQVGEDYEGVYVRVEMLKTTATPDNYDEWMTITDEGVEVKIDNQLYFYNPDMGQRYHVQGVVNYTYSEFKLAPTVKADVEIVTGLQALDINIEVYPNPFNDYVAFRVAGQVEISKAVITNIAGQLIKEVINPDNTISTTELRSGVYFISLHTEDGIAKTERIIKR